MKSSNVITEPVIKVGIQLNSLIEFELKGDFECEGKTINTDNYVVTIVDNKLITNFITSNKIILKPLSSSSTFILKKVTIGIGFHWEQQEIQEFEGGLLFQPENGKIRAINIIPLESYLKSVISSEMSAMNDLNLLKAHAIVSRSWLLAQIQNSNKKDTDCFNFSNENSHNNDSLTEVIKWYDREDHATFDVCADDHCQRYQGITKTISKNTDHAIESTRGMVLTYDDEICDARFSKCCGGISEDFENVWQPCKVPYLTSVIDNIPENILRSLRYNEFITSSPEVFCNTTDPKVLNQILTDFDRSTTDFFRWKKEYSQKELSEIIKQKSGFDFGDIIDLIPIKRGKSGRIIKLEITGSRKKIIVGKELEIRKWLSETHLYSSAFIVEKRFFNNEITPSHFILMGAGWGHGVGMCQIGAAVMSKKGYKVETILKHYFRDSQLLKWYL